MHTKCAVYCPICQILMDWMRGYGRECRCCSKNCHDEFEWRRTLAIIEKPYYTRPKSESNNPP